MTETVDLRVLWDAAEVGQPGPPWHGRLICFETDPETGFICGRATNHGGHQHVALSSPDRESPTTVVAIWPGDRQ
jgi:hypothetical protein